MQPDRTDELTRLMRERILVLDGAMGTMIQQLKLGESDFRGAPACGLSDHGHDLKGDNDLLVLTKPEVKAAFAADGTEPAGGTPEQLRDSMRSGIAQWGKLVRDLGVKL